MNVVLCSSLLAFLGVVVATTGITNYKANHNIVKQNVMKNHGHRLL